MISRTLLRASAGIAAIGFAIMSAHASQICTGADFNGDRKSDALWHNAISGENYVFLMNGAAVLSDSNYTNSVPDMTWKVAATGDFDGDGRADIFWRRANGDNYIFFMDGTTVKANSTYTNSVPDANWEIAGAGDFNGDGKVDVLWRNASTGENYIFLMNGGTVLASSNFINSVPDTRWNVAGVGDFNGDGKSDILWRHASTGENYIYFMNGTTVLGSSTYTDQVTDTNWGVAGVGDFNGDGKADILWRNASTGEDYIFFMNGATVLGSSTYTNTVPDMNWKIVDVGDHDNDGKSDILWRNTATGENYVFFMNGTSVLSSSGYTNAVPDPSWGLAPVFEVSLLLGVSVNRIPCQPVDLSSAVNLIVSLFVPTASSLP